MAPEAEICSGTRWQSRTSRASVAPKSMEEDDDGRRSGRVEVLRDMNQHVRIAERLVRPQDLTVSGAVAPAPACGDVEKWPLAGFEAIEGERRGIESDEFGRAVRPKALGLLRALERRRSLGCFGDLRHARAHATSDRQRERGNNGRMCFAMFRVARGARVRRRRPASVFSCRIQLSSFA